MTAAQSAAEPADRTADDTVVGVLTYNADDDYDRGRGLVADKATLTQAVSGARADDAGDADPADEN